MNTNDLARAQSDLRFAYRSGSVGQIYGGLTWLISATAWTVVGATVAVILLLVGGFFIYPVTVVFSRLRGSPGVVSASNPLREASITIPFVGVLGIPVAGAAALHEIDWFYPAFMMVMGAHYLPFSFLYGMRVFVFLGAAMWVIGLSLALWASGFTVLGGWMTGLGLLAVGIWAARQHEAEFAPSD